MANGKWEDARPRVVLSRCLELAACRYDGAGIPSREVRLLASHVEWVPVCPEVEIGLGVPRAPIRVESSPEGPRLVQPSTGRDLTERMTGFGAGFADGAGEVDGLLLKSRSPSCGHGDVKVYEGGEPVSAEGSGLFAAALRKRYPTVAMIDEARLMEGAQWHHWLTRVFASARLRAAAAGGVEGLRDFHTRYKLVLMAHSVAGQRSLGRLVSEARPGAPADVARTVAEYRRGFDRALREPASRGGHLNAIQHVQGYFKNELGPPEKRAFEGAQEAYRRGLLPIPALLTVLAEWVERFDHEYLREQLYIRPYPTALLAAGEEAGVREAGGAEGGG